MRGTWLKAFCTSGGNCDWVVLVAPIIFIAMILVCGYSARQTYINKIKGKKLYDPDKNPNGYVLSDLISMLFWVMGAIFIIGVIITGIILTIRIN